MIKMYWICFLVIVVTLVGCSPTKTNFNTLEGYTLGEYCEGPEFMMEEGIVVNPKQQSEYALIDRKLSRINLSRSYEVTAVCSASDNKIAKIHLTTNSIRTKGSLVGQVMLKFGTPEEELEGVTFDLSNGVTREGYVKIRTWSEENYVAVLTFGSQPSSTSEATYGNSGQADLSIQDNLILGKEWQDITSLKLAEIVKINTE